MSSARLEFPKEGLPVRGQVGSGRWGPARAGVSLGPAHFSAEVWLPGKGLCCCTCGALGEVSHALPRCHRPAQGQSSHGSCLVLALMAGALRARQPGDHWTPDEVRPGRPECGCWTGGRDPASLPPSAEAQAHQDALAFRALRPDGADWGAEPPGCPCRGPSPLGSLVLATCPPSPRQKLTALVSLISSYHFQVVLSG